MGLLTRRRTKTPPTSVAPADTSVDLAPLDPTLGHPGAVAFRTAVLTADYSQATTVFGAAANNNDRAHYLTVVAHEPGVVAAVTDWPDLEPTAPLPLLVRGAHTIGLAWEAIEAAADDPETSGLAGAADVDLEHLHQAESDLLQVTQLVPSDALSWAQLVQTGAGLGIPAEERTMRFEQARRRDPHLFNAYVAQLQSLRPAWHGPEGAALAFARDASESAGPGSPLHALIARVHFDEWYATLGNKSASAYFDEDVTEEVLAAANKSVLHPQFTDVADYVPGLEALNGFAIVMAMCEEMATARSLLDAVAGPRLTSSPWDAFGDEPRARFRHISTVVDKALAAAAPTH